MNLTKMVKIEAIKTPKIIDCVQCGVFLGVITKNGFMVGNVIMSMDDLPDTLCCAECEKSVLDSILNLVFPD